MSGIYNNKQFQKQSEYIKAQIAWLRNKADAIAREIPWDLQKTDAAKDAAKELVNITNQAAYGFLQGMYYATALYSEGEESELYPIDMASPNLMWNIAERIRDLYDRISYGSHDKYYSLKRNIVLFASTFEHLSVTIDRYILWFHCVFIIDRRTGDVKNVMWHEDVSKEDQPFMSLILPKYCMLPGYREAIMKRLEPTDAYTWKFKENVIDEFMHTNSTFDTIRKEIEIEIITSM